MEEENSLSFIKQLSLSVITLVLGSFIFVGVLENYKSDEALKLKQLENYFKPARESINSCLKMQNDLYLHYPQYSGSMKLMFGELKNLINKPELNGNHQYGLILEGYAKNLINVQETQKKLPPKVEKCRQETFLKLESLSIATGSYDFFKSKSEIRAEKLNTIDKKFREELKGSNGDLDEKKIIQMVRDFGEINAHSEDEWKKLILDFSDKLPVIEGYSSALYTAEVSKYKVESEFFGAIRNNTAKQINDRFKQGFFSWLF